MSSDSSADGTLLGGDSPTRVGKRMRSDSSLIHETKIASTAQTLTVEFQNLRRENAFVDVLFTCKSAPFDAIRAHAAFLSASCPKLGKLISKAGERNAEHEYVCQVTEEPGTLSFPALRKLVDFLYTNDLPVRSAKEIREVTETAQFLQIPIPLLVLSESNRLECANTLIGHLGYVCALTLTRDGLLVSGARDNSIRVWDPTCSKPRVELADVHSNRVWALATYIDPSSQEEKVISGSWDATLIVWNPKTWRLEKRLTGHDDWVTCLAVVGTKHIVSGSADSTLRVWNITNYEPERVLRGHRGHIYAVCVSGNSEYLYSAGSDGCIYVWETKHWRIVQKLKGHPDCIVRALAWCPALNCLVSGASDGRLRTWMMRGNEKVTFEYDLEAHTDWVEACCDMSKGRFASGSRDCTVKIWNAQGSWECLQTIRQHSHWVYALIFERDMLVSASCDMKIKIWEEEKEIAEGVQ